MTPNQALWAKGDFTKLADTMRQSSAALVDKIGISKDLKVLDLGCGDGDTALPTAKYGATVLGVDITSYLVEAGKRRAEKEGLTNCSFQQGDAAELQQLKDGSFDLVMSVFGAMFSPRPFDVAKEMVRVTIPGGRIVMGNWIPGDPTLVSQTLNICSKYTPPPPEGFISPMLWGVEDHVIQRFANAGVPNENISFEKDTFNFIAPYSPSQFLKTFKDYYAPTMTAFEAAEKNGKATEMHQELEDLFNSQNKSSNGNSTFIPATFLIVTVKL